MDNAEPRDRAYPPASTAGSSPMDNPAFRRWFGDSKVVDAHGQPLVLFHGTGQDVSAFKGMVWGSVDPTLASEYAEMRQEWYNGAGNVMPIYMRIEQPFDADVLPSAVRVNHVVEAVEAQARSAGVVISDDLRRKLFHIQSRLIYLARERAGSGPHYSAHDFWNDSHSLFTSDGAAMIRRLFRITGFDGIRYTEQNVLSFGAFSSRQVKSAIANVGTFRRGSDVITETAPPGKKAEDFIRDNKKAFKKRYGKHWASYLYGTAWRMFGEGIQSPPDIVAEAATLPAKVRQMLFANRKLDEGTRVAVRLNLNGGMIDYAGSRWRLQTVHEGSTAKGHVLGYDTGVTLSGVTFYIDHRARMAIREGAAKSPMAAVLGEVVHAHPDFGGVQIRFNPRETEFFVEVATGRPVIAAETATVCGDRVYARGITYGDEASARAP